MKQKIFKLLADLRFAITILLLIASLSIIGTVIEQDQSTEVYKSNYPLTNKVFGILSWDIILKFGLDHVYKSWWFIFLIILLGISLLSCTSLQQLPTLKLARRCQFFRTSSQFSRLKILAKLKIDVYEPIIYKIRKNKYSIFGPIIFVLQVNLFPAYRKFLQPRTVQIQLLYLLPGL